MNKHLAAFLSGLAAAGALAYAMERAGIAVPWERKRRNAEAAAGQENMAPMEIERPVRSIDLNTADVDEIALMAGIDPELADRIIENRPYRNKLDLLSRMVVTEDVYESIRHIIMVDGAEDSIKVA